MEKVKHKNKVVLHYKVNITFMYMIGKHLLMGARGRNDISERREAEWISQFVYSAKRAKQKKLILTLCQLSQFNYRTIVRL